MECLLQKIVTLHAIISLTLNFVMDIFLQTLRYFQNSWLQKPLRKCFVNEHIRRHEYIKYITHANFNISLYVLIYIKMLPWKFRILNPKNRRVIHPYSSYISSKAGSFLTYSTFSVLFVNKHFANFTDKWFKNSYDMECEILRVLFSYEHEHVRRF